jgi:lysophospholipase L1-like esterase
MSRRWGRRAVAALVAAVTAVGLVGLPGAAAPRLTSPLSIVQLGDSVASGEGTLYGYRYDQSTRRWTGGNVNVTWPGPYPDCHVSPDAYGDLVATSLQAKFTTFACTGASYANGITSAQVSSGLLGTTILSPAQFGDWSSGAMLNPKYDAARPDLVLLTLGADDLRFAPVVTDCVKSFIEHAVGGTLRCTQANPGDTLTNDFTNNLFQLGPNLDALVQAIRARGQRDGHVPKVVVTLYHDPFPTGSQTCPDVALLDPSQISYLRTLIPMVNEAIRTGLKGQPGVTIADTSIAMTGPQGQNHRWCSSQPWAYGLSIFSITDLTSLLSQAPFHPTVDGQARFAALVTPVVKRVLGR